jgi:hypothetical protein
MIAPLEAQNILLRALADETLDFTECLESLAALCGRKKMLRFTGRVERLECLSELMESIDLPHVIAPLHLRTDFTTPLGDTFSRIQEGSPKHDETGILFAGQSETVQAALAIERGGCPSAEVAALYGYPPCCATAYEFIRQGTFWADIFLRDALGIMRVSWLMNRFARLFSPFLSMLPDYFPCSLHCHESLALAQSYADTLEENGLPTLLEAARQHMLRPVLRYAGCLYQLEIQGGTSLEKNLSVKDGLGLDADILAVWPYSGQPLLTQHLTLEQQDGKLHIHARDNNGTLPDDPHAVCIHFF